MKALDRKLLRDLRLMWSQALTIALVVASGIGGFITSLSAVDSLALARDRFYASGQFADVFARVKRAPLGLVESLRDIPGIADLQVGVEAMARTELPGVPDPIIGQVVGLDLRHPQRMNRVTVSSGQDLASAGTDAGGAIPAWVSEGFAQARGLEPGDTVRVLINGKQRTLRMVGTALSPEYIFAGLWGMPDMRGYGIFWIDKEVLAAADDMDGAFNQLAAKLAPGASERAVIDALSARLQAYGGRDVHGREQQASHQMLDAEIKEQRVLGTVLPTIFLAVAAFLLNVVVARMVSTQREQIATMKALGYDNLAIGGHYVKFVVAVVVVGSLLGIVVGDRLGTAFTGLYAELFHLPRFEHRTAPWLVISGVGASLAAALLGTLNAIARTVRLPPAEAMRPPAPGRYRRTFLERMDVRANHPALRMIVRNMARRRLRTALGVAGIAAAIAITVMGNFIRDAIEVIVDTQFTLALRGDISVWTYDPVDDAARLELARLPGVKEVEATRFVQATLVHGHRRERCLVRGYAPRASLYRVVDVAQQETLLEGRGLILTDRLADKLGARTGDRVQVEVIEGEPRTLVLPLSGTVREMMGLNAYIDRVTLNRLLGDGDVATGYVLSVERGEEARALDATKALPRAGGAWSKATMLRNMQEISARNVRIMSTVLTTFAAVIAVGVVYNNARIALSERGWELASLRVLGFTRVEVSTLLLGELAITIAVAIPLGMGLGWVLVHGVSELLKSDQFYFPVVIRARTYAWASLCAVCAGVASGLVVRRRIDRLDLVAVLKTRD